MYESPDPGDPDDDEHSTDPTDELWEEPSGEDVDLFDGDEDE
jgi:hypothetical protein